MSSLEAVRARFARNEGLPFANILTEVSIRDVLNEHGVKYRDRVFSPVTTIWGFLSQVLNEDHSCRDAVTPHSPILVFQDFRRSILFRWLFGFHIHSEKEFRESLR